MAARYTFTAPLWQWMARRDAWFFVTVPEEISEEIRAIADGLTGGFNSVPVRVQVGSTRWATSIFPGSAGGAYSLPMKKAVRVAEGIGLDDPVGVELELNL